ncbi:MAG: aspartate carbamoyltransferase [Candidatus Woesearchaeota archaeon]
MGDVISIQDFSKDEINKLLALAGKMKQIEESGKRYSLQLPRTFRLANLFYEPSTRTRQSFITAIVELGGRAGGFSGIEGTSVTKKESIRDTIKMFEANHADAIVMRHPKDGSVQWAADVSEIPVINGGDGKNEHPTQALLDLFTMSTLREKLDGIKVGYGGDLAHGRTIHSQTLALANYDNVEIHWCAEDFLGMPTSLTEHLAKKGVKVVRHAEVVDVMKNVDVFYMTRPQLERMGSSASQVHDLMDKYRITLERVREFKGKVLHPLPVNSELAEIDHAVYFSDAQGFFKQAENGIFLRKALLYSMFKDAEIVQFSGILNPLLENGNNILLRHGSKNREPGIINDIKDGVVIDHIAKGLELEIGMQLKLKERGKLAIFAHIPQKSTNILKTDLPSLTDRDLKRAALISPETTINYINKGTITKKFVYLLCQNQNCISRVVEEDIPPKFFKMNNEPCCRYCRSRYMFKSDKINREERLNFVKTLPQSVEPL